MTWTGPERRRLAGDRLVDRQRLPLAGRQALRRHAARFGEPKPAASRPSASYTGTLTATLPSSLADGTYQVIVVTDSGDAVATDPNRANNQSSRPQPLDLRPRRSRPVDHVGPDGRDVRNIDLTVNWSTTNDGTAPTLDRLGRRRLPLDHQPGHGQLAAAGHGVASRAAGPGQSVTGSASATIPLGDSGTYQIIVVADATNQLIEPGGTSNSASQAINITLAPYADLAVSNVVAPTQTIGDPAYPTISWTVTNVGTGAGQTSTWTDAIIASPTDNVADPSAVVLAEYPHTGGLAAGAELHPDADRRRCRRASPGATTCSSRPTPATRSSRTARRPTTSPRTRTTST